MSVKLEQITLVSTILIFEQSCILWFIANETQIFDDHWNSPLGDMFYYIIIDLEQMQIGLCET